MIHKRLLLSLLVLPSCHLKAWNPLSDHTLREGIYFTFAAAGVGAFVYSWMNKKALQKTLDDHTKRFRNHEFLTDCYEDALNALADYKDYVELLDHNLSHGESVKELCQYLTQEFSQNTHLVPAFKKAVFERKQGLEKKNKEIERSLIEWKDSRKKAVLTQQGPLLKNTFALILSTLDMLNTHLPYIEASFFIKEHGDLLSDERALEKHLTDASQFKHTLDKLIRAKARVGERYPFRAYAQWVDQYFVRVRELKKELENFTYVEFQRPVIEDLTSMYNILALMQKQIKVSPEYEAECAQFNAELLARSHEHENRKLKEQLASIKDEMSTLKRPSDSPQKA